MIMNRNVKKWAAALMGTAMMFGLLSCGGKSSSRVKTNEKGEILEVVVANQSETGEYDPAGAAAYVYFSHQTYTLDPLVTYTPDGLFKAATAEKWEVSKDLLTYTFWIRDDAKWSDGSNVTSMDYKNTMMRALLPENGAWYVDFLFPIKGATEAFNGTGSLEDVAIEATDPKVLKITLEKPCSYFLDMFANVPTFMPSNCKYAKKEDKFWDMDPAKNLGNGPWYMAERKPGEYILYTCSKPTMASSRAASKMCCSSLPKARLKNAKLNTRASRCILSASIPKS